MANLGAILTKLLHSNNKLKLLAKRYFEVWTRHLNLIIEIQQWKNSINSNVCRQGKFERKIIKCQKWQLIEIELSL